MKPMRLSQVDQLPQGADWVYEVKYDGFRSVLKWEKEEVVLLSKTGKILNTSFPEIIRFCSELHEDVKSFLPLFLDGELVYLMNSYQSDFSIVQRRSRVKQKQMIETHAAQLACHFVTFDLITFKGKSLTNQPLLERKKQLFSLFETLHLPLHVQPQRSKSVQAISYTSNDAQIWENSKWAGAEGVIAKKKTSLYEPGSRSKQWLKKKNWRLVTVVITSFTKGNGYFEGSVLKDESWIPVVHVRHGFTPDEKKALIDMFYQNGIETTNSQWQIPPSICLNVACIDFDGKHLREPQFASFQLDKDPFDCEWDHMLRQLHPLPSEVKMTSPDKTVWSSHTKNDYMLFLQNIAPYLLPHLKDRLLTVIRYPQGTGGEPFYQKNCPDYAPSYVNTVRHGKIDYVVCNNLETLLWLGNQLALEFHTPFQPTSSSTPDEIVLDLDPPSVNEFTLAVDAALRLKDVFDEFQLTSYVKTSGRKGLQVYLPLPPGRFTYMETRTFTSFVCKFLCEQEPDRFTVERLKKNRKKRLYLDYLQHDLGKTIIAPYSPRGTKEGLVATPLYWHEVNRSLHPREFTLPSVIERLKETGDPFRFMKETDNGEALGRVIHTLTDK
ncbi:DNA ligase D [Salipaludibacillus keqinensis]|uniref:DNA ligase (ATP) n=1 Tax=Salipaludibacillus keqinensis TaxID=2045207 RepID=A0A323T546_9BACI|nr:DNA ligase D [Salipaludibacillus keqinensis]PYZ91601.1 DNA ligase D [Salipaludibacillus keqinensis]